MSLIPRRIAVLGSTGSIGTATLDVVAASAGRFEIAALAAHSNATLLLEQCRKFHPSMVAVTDQDAAKRVRAELDPAISLLAGPDAAAELAATCEAEIVVAAIVGSAGLAGAWSAIEAGKTLALANKETLVMAGSLVTRLAAERNVKILPVDSEHSAVFQALQAGKPGEVERLVLTASGGPFRNHTSEQLAGVTIDDALAHPTWRMGRKITVDSATMMNKALEIIEARWLFDVPAEKIDVVIHKQSIVHSLVEFADGSVLAQLSPPDMRLPIQYALSWPDRFASPAAKMDWTRAFQLDFEPPDEARFPALRLGHETASRGGTAGAVLNAANEAAVARFLAGEIAYRDIVPACRAVLEHHSFDSQPSLGELIRLDAWAREEISLWKR